MSRRFYRIILHFYPHAFRARFGRDMEETFDADLEDARTCGALAVSGLWARTLGQAVLLGAEARFAPIISTSREHPR